MKKLLILAILLPVILFNSICFSETKESKHKRVDEFVSKLNNGAAATYNNFSFSCKDIEEKTPVLVLKATVVCLECAICKEKMDNFLGWSFLFISEVWHKNFGTYRVNILNDVDKVVYIINEQHELLKPIPLPRGMAGL